LLPAAETNAGAAASSASAGPSAEAAQPASGPRPNVRVEDGHTGEQVLVAAAGPGAHRVRGFIRNTDVFRIMMAAYGWDRSAPAAR
jgi:alkaline phosphatase